MQIAAEQLPNHLKRGLAPMYFVYGDEPLLVEESCRAIHHAAIAAGHPERQIVTVEAGFDWDALYVSTRSLSLFSQRRLIELRLPTGKPGEAGAKILVEIAAQPPMDIVFVVRVGKLDKEAREAKWVKALERVATTVAIYPLETAQLPAWISRRMRERGLEPGAGVVELLANLMQGNLLALAQEIEKLVMLFGQCAVSLDDIEANLSDNARFNVFALADASLRGEAAVTRRILTSLRAEGVESVLVLWALVRETRELAQISALVASGQPLMQVLDARRVWAKRKPLVSQALKRLRPNEWLDLLLLAARTDRVLKGRRAGDVWRELECLALGIGGLKLNTGE